MPAQTDESTEKRALRAFTLELRGAGEQGEGPEYLTLPINPQSVSISHASRALAQQTLGGQYVEEWGAGFRTITLEGHTGYAPRAPIDGVEPLDGYQAFQQLVAMLQKYFKATTKRTSAGQPAAAAAGFGIPILDALINLFAGGKDDVPTLILHYWEEDEHWYVIPTGPDALRRTRNSQAPLLFNYTLSLTAVKDATVSPELAGMLGLPAPDGLVDGLLGALGGFGDWAKQAGAALGGLAKTANDWVAKAKNAANAIKKVTSGISTLINVAMAPVRAIIKTGRELSRAIAGAVAGVTSIRAAAMRALRDLRTVVCAFAHLERTFGRLFAPLTNGWGQFGQAFERC